MGSRTPLELSARQLSPQPWRSHYICNTIASPIAQATIITNTEFSRARAELSGCRVESDGGFATASPLQHGVAVGSEIFDGE
jgi:hypothetical protein